jgi:hypothetical protein
MRFKKTRIAWSVAWGILVLLLAILWVRSYLEYDRIVVNYPNGLDWFIVYLNKGVTIVSTYGLLAPELMNRWCFVARTGWGTIVCVPFSFMIAAACLISSAPWIRLRFSLRTLLIITTIVAVALGLIIYFTKN